MIKASRLSLILGIIEKYPVSTQQELQSYLTRHGVTVTQATVSRDMKELRLNKSVNANGVYCYGVPHESPSGDFIGKFRTIFVESVISFASSGNLLIIKCYNGMGNAACAALDSMNFSSVVGTIAGDDTIFAAIESPEKCSELLAKLKSMLDV